jgi:hypothetical protein
MPRDGARSSLPPSLPTSRLRGVVLQTAPAASVSIDCSFIKRRQQAFRITHRASTERRRVADRVIFALSLSDLKPKRRRPANACRVAQWKQQQQHRETPTHLSNMDLPISCVNTAARQHLHRHVGV